MSFGTKGCLYNCGDKCTGECLNNYKLRQRPIQETLSLFKEGDKRYMTDQIFRQTIDCLCLGGAPEKIIEQLIDVINSQQEEINRLLE